MYEHELRLRLYDVLIGESEWLVPEHSVVPLVLEAIGVAGIYLEHHSDHGERPEDCGLRGRVWDPEKQEFVLAWESEICMGDSVLGSYMHFGCMILQDDSQIDSEAVQLAQQEFRDAIRPAPWAVCAVKAPLEEVEGEDIHTRIKRREDQPAVFVVATNIRDAHRFIEDEEGYPAFSTDADFVADLPDHLCPDEDVLEPQAVEVGTDWHAFVQVVLRELEVEDGKKWIQ